MMLHRIILATPTPRFVQWNDGLGLLSIEPLKHAEPKAWRDIPRLSRFTFDDGHDIRLPVMSTGTNLHLSSIGLVQLMFLHMLKHGSFNPQTDFQKYFSRTHIDLNNARNWCGHVLPFLTSDDLPTGSFARYSVGRERMMRTQLWQALSGR